MAQVFISLASSSFACQNDCWTLKVLRKFTKIEGRIEEKNEERDYAIHDRG